MTSVCRAVGGYPVAGSRAADTSWQHRAMPAHVSSPVPTDDFTPFGYLNLASHTRRLNPKGVMRSAGVGFGWHFPSLASGYGGRTEQYRAGFGFGWHGRSGLDAFDRVDCPYHSANLFEFHAHQGSELLDARFFLVDDDILCARVEPPVPHAATAHVWYRRTVAGNGEWGESGLVGRMDGNVAIVQSFEDGEVFAVQALDAAMAVDFGSPPPVTRIADHAQVAELALTLRPTESADEGLWVVMARGRTADEAIGRLPGRARLVAAQTDRCVADDAFWRSAPTLSGDWPAHWRRGLVYDLETLRMMVKQPVGIYRHVWDAMQIQSPRTVLGEAAMDALALSWADPQLAADLLVGTFANAPLPNVPCSREDGTYNMVSADGTVCGTGPQWGYPFLAAQLIDARLGDDDWLAEMYPLLAAYLRWWGEHRRRDGWFVHACSWESGQDLSPRFGPQPLGGGHPTWQTQPVDLHAAVAHAARVLAGFADRVAPGEAAEWQALAADVSQRTESMWAGSRYADQRGGQATDVDDVMLLSPVALGLASDQHVSALSPAIRGLHPDDLVWPMFVWTPVLAAAAAGHHADAARLAAAVVDRAYRFCDRRDADPSHTLPGIAAEHWPLSGRRGGEGYGWGAFTTELLLSSVIGLEVDGAGVGLRAVLPPELREPGRRYELAVTVRGHQLLLVLEPTPDTLVVSGLGEPAHVRWDALLHRSWGSLTPS